MCAELQISWGHNLLQSICNKSRKLVGLLYHQFYLNADSDTLRHFYLSCIRPHLEYACTVHVGPLPGKRENPSGGSAKVCLQCCKNWNVDYESMLGHLNIPTLQQRRLQLKTSMMYQFVHGDSYIPEDVLLLHPPSNYDTHNCSYFSIPYARTNPSSHHITFLELTSTCCSSRTKQFSI